MNPDILPDLQRALGDTYAIQRELSGGAMGRVFVARETALGRDVVIKVRIDDGRSLAAERFLREIAVAARLRHPNIVPVLSSGQAAGMAYYTMPFITGRTLRDVLLEGGRLPVATALQYALEVTDALSYAHSQGIIHRDIKPENILIDSGHAVVTDFGLARALSTTESAALTQHGVAVGTPLYMSPEQISGDHQIDGRTDIFSLACVLYEMLTGAPPFTGETMAAILASRFRESTVKLRTARPEVPGWIASAVEKALATDPGNRYTSAELFADALKHIGGTRAWAVPAAMVSSASLILALIAFMAARQWRSHPSAPSVEQKTAVQSGAPVIFNGGTEELLRYAIDRYNQLEIEAAIENLRFMISPNYLQPVSREQRVKAYMYLGAAFTDAGKADSARYFFMGALAYDPFVRADNTWASVEAREAFQKARNAVFVLQAEDLREHVLKEGSDVRPYEFVIGVTQPTRVIVTVASERDSSFSRTLFDSKADGTIQVAWNGTLGSGTLANVGLYALRVSAPPSGGSTPVTKTYPFRIEVRQNPRNGARQLVMIPGR